MTKLKFFLLAFILPTLLFGQQIAIKNFIKIPKSEFIKHQTPDKQLWNPSTIQKTKGVITFKSSAKKIILKDDGEFLEYKIINDLAETSLTLIQMLEPNSEEYYFINRKTLKIDTLVGKPIFSKNLQDIVCLQGAETDIKQQIQIGKIINRIYVNRGKIKLRDGILPNYIFWFNANTLFIEDSNRQFWKLIF